MKKTLLVALALGYLTVLPSARCADAKAELQDLTGKLSDQLHTGKTTPEDLAPFLKQLDALLAEHKDEKTEDVANILLMKAMVHMQVMGDNAAASAELQQLKTDFPDTSLAKNADSMIAALAKEEVSAKIRRSLTVGTVFPPFQETDLDGKPLSTAAEKGKVVLIDFWATWCGPCVHELPNVQKVYAAYHDKGFDVIGISLDQDKDELVDFLKKQAMPWPQYFDGKGWENKVSTTYGIDSIPATYLLDRDGKIIGVALRGDDLEAAVKKALAVN